MAASQAARKLLGAWYTPPELVDLVVDGVLDLAAAPLPRDRPVRVLDPAGGDGRFVVAVADRLRRRGHAIDATVCDVDRSALDAVPGTSITCIHDDALRRDWGPATFDVVVGNPPFLSQMAAATTRRGSSRHGGGPYADAAAEFLALAVRLADPDRGRIGLVLPQSILAARDARPVRAEVATLADLDWSWWQHDQRHFDAAVNVCALGFRRPSRGRTTEASWTRVVTERMGIPPLDIEQLRVSGTIGDRAELNANFRDEYYALVPAVSDRFEGPPLVTSGLIDPGVNHWGTRPVRFAKRDHTAPRVDLAQLHGKFAAWAQRKLVPKVLVANQTQVVEAVADPGGEWLPAVPITSIVPHDPACVWPIAAALTSPIATIAAWQQAAGTGLSTRSVRMSPAVLAGLPWPAGALDGAVDALRDGDVAECGRRVCEAFGVDHVAHVAHVDRVAHVDHVDQVDLDVDRLVAWWTARLP